MAGTLRDWSVGSYDNTTGRAKSSLSEGRQDGEHIGAAKAGGQNGAPGVSAQNKSGSADTGRRKMGGSTVD